MKAKIHFWKNLLFLFIIILLCLIICELIVRVFIPVRNVGPSFTVYDPVFGKKNKTDFSAKRFTPEFTMKIAFNSDGYRGQEIESFENRNIIFLGDSFTLGYGVNDDEEFPALIRKDFSDDVSVINAGMGDNGNGRWLKFLKTKAEKYNPELLVFQIMGNDFDENKMENLFRISSSKELKELHVAPPGLARKVQKIVEFVPFVPYSYLIGLLRQARIKTSSKPTRAVKNKINVELSYREKLTLKILDECFSFYQKKDWQMMIILVGISGRKFDVLEELLAKYNFPIIQIPSKKERPELYYIIDGHWNKDGHIYTANVISQNLKKHFPEFYTNP